MNQMCNMKDVTHSDECRELSVVIAYPVTSTQPFGAFTDWCTYSSHPSCFQVKTDHALPAQNQTPDRQKFITEHSGAFSS